MVSLISRKTTKSLAASLLPGALVGAHLTGLLYFLNPDLAIRPLGLSSTLFLYSGAFALVSAVAQLPWALRAPDRVLRSLPWLLTAVLSLFSLLAGLHASIFAFYLPPGVNIRLLKAAGFLGLAAVIAFYTSLLHALSSRPYGPRSRVGLWLLALASLYLVVERREAYHPDLRPTLASSVEHSLSATLVVVGIDGATLDVILPLCEQGQLPFLAESLRTGSYARLRPLTPSRTAPSWTTLTTGKWPYKHGVIDTRRHRVRGFDSKDSLSLLPLGLGFRSWGVNRSSSPPSSRRALSAWEITSRLGLPSGVVGWTTSPGTSGLLFSVSSEFLDTGRPSSVSPKGLIARRELFHSPIASSSDLDEFPESTREVSSPAVHRDEQLSRIFETLSGEAPQAKALFLRLPGLNEVSRHYFGAWAASPFEVASESDLNDASRTLVAYYRWLDSSLERLWSGVSQPSVFAIVSANGLSTARVVAASWEIDKTSSWHRRRHRWDPDP